MDRVVLSTRFVLVNRCSAFRSMLPLAFLEYLKGLDLYTHVRLLLVFDTVAAVARVSGSSYTRLIRGVRSYVKDKVRSFIREPSASLTSIDVDRDVAIEVAPGLGKYGQLRVSGFANALQVDNLSKGA